MFARHFFMVCLPFCIQACTEYTVERPTGQSNGGPVVNADPNPVLFGDLPSGERSTRSFTVSNGGNATLRVDTVTIEGAKSFSVMSPVVSGDLLPDESFDVLVQYTSNGKSHDGVARIYSNDPSSPSYDVGLVSASDYCHIEADPPSYDFGTVMLGQAEQTTIALTNAGTAPCTITGLSVEDGQFTVTPAKKVPFSMAPGVSTQVDVLYLPDTEDPVETNLEVVSNAFDSPTLVGLSSDGPGSRPIAICSVDPDQISLHTGSTATWIGAESYDPSGLDITSYDWRLISIPAGSTATMPSGSGPNRSGFYPDLVGTYMGQLVVTNEDGFSSAPCTATLDGVTLQDLWIEMYWTHALDDMDLHLVRPVSDAEGSLRTRNDCYFSDCIDADLDWGAHGESADDPSLDLDDINGVGPENINVESPEDGVFTVYVHDYPESVYDGENDVTVTVYIGGVAVWTATRNVDAEGFFEPYCEIDWPSGRVTSL
jgi:hypothetical protein